MGFIEVPGIGRISMQLLQDDAKFRNAAEAVGLTDYEVIDDTVYLPPEKAGSVVKAMGFRVMTPREFLLAYEHLREAGAELSPQVQETLDAVVTGAAASSMQLYLERTGAKYEIELPEPGRDLTIHFRQEDMHDPTGLPLRNNPDGPYALDLNSLLGASGSLSLAGTISTRTGKDVPCLVFQDPTTITEGGQLELYKSIRPIAL